MSWWRRSPEPHAPEATVDPQAASAAAAASAHRLLEEQQRSAEIRQISTSLRTLRERNHFSELFAETMQKGT